ncbi:hypothetical protein MBANPS3_007582 [Mucor bainieri]
MASNQESEPLSPIDNDLFRAYTRYQLCQLKYSTSLWTSNQEKEAMLNVLSQFESINGNTLRMVINEIFKNSVQTLDFIDTDDQAAPRYQEEPTSTFHRDDYRSSPSPPVSARVSVVIQERPLAGRSKKADPIVEKLKKFMSRPNRIVLSICPTELYDLTDHVERGKYVVLTRMRRVSTSFKFKTSGAAANHSLRITNSFNDPRSPMSMCQANLIAYRFGKLFEHAKKGKQTRKAETACYNVIKATPASKYVRYAQNIVKAAEKIGVYALFIPEILTPYALQIISRSNFPILKGCLDVKCAGFNEIARFDYDGDLIMEEINYSRKYGDKSYRRTESKLLNSCA